MRYTLLILSLIIAFLPNQAIPAAELYGNIRPGGVVTAAIDSPTVGQAVQGAVVIRGSTAVEGFQSYEVDFTNAGDPAPVWVLVQESTEPIQDGILAVWDTITISDGDYNLRLVIYKTDSSQTELTVLGLRVRNSAPMETGTPSPTVMLVTLGPGTATRTPTPSVTPLPSTPTPLPANPAEVTAPQVLSTFGKGAAISIGLLLLLGAYVGLKAFTSGRK